MAEQKVIMTDPRQEDYFYQEAIKNEYPVCRDGCKDNSVYKLLSERRKERYYVPTFAGDRKIREKGTSSRRRYPQVDTRIPVRSGKTGSGIIKLLERSGFYRGDYLSYEL